MKRSFVRLAFIVALVLTPLAPAGPVVAAAPWIVLVSPAHYLTEPVVLTDPAAIAPLFDGDIDDHFDHASLADRPFFDLSLFWGPEWADYLGAKKPLDALTPDLANQHGRFYPAVPDAGALIALDAVPGAPATIRPVSISARAVIARAGILLDDERIPAAIRSGPDGAPPLCPVTQPASRQPDEFGNRVIGYGNDALWTNVWMWEEGFIPASAAERHRQADGSFAEFKWAWYRYVPGKLTIEGRRLDAPAPPLSAWIPDGYGQTGFQVSGLTFPTAGCWEITGHLGAASLTFIIYLVDPGGNQRS